MKLNLHRMLLILLYGLDYSKKRIVCTKMIQPNGQVEEQMEEIKAYFKNGEISVPEKKGLGEI